MPTRGLYRKRYEKVLDHLKANTEWEKEVLVECGKLLSGAMQTKGDSRKSYFDHLDFRLEETFGVKVAIPTY